MRTRLLVVLAVTASLTACGGDSHKSSGGGPKVPDLVGKNWSDATDQLSLAGIPYISQKVGGQSATPAQETDFEVCSTKPKAGEPAGTDITMFIAPKGKC